MRCSKCGNEVGKDDLFCEKCGNKINRIETNQIFEEKQTKKKSKWKKMLSIAIVCLIVVIGGLIYIGSQPRDIEMNAKELAKILLSEDTASEYYGDYIHVSGFVLNGVERKYALGNYDEDDPYNKLYTLYADENDENSISFFEYKDGLTDDIGTGSEIIVNGKIGKLKNSGELILIADSVEIKKKVETTYIINDIQTLMQHSNELVNKKIEVSGIMYFGQSIVFLKDFYSDYRFLMLDVNHEEALYSIGDNEYCTVSGKFILNQGEPTLIVDKVAK